MSRVGPDGAREFESLAAVGLSCVLFVVLALLCVSGIVWQLVSGAWFPTIIGFL